MVADVDAVDDVEDDEERSASIAGHPLVRALRRDVEREVWVARDAVDAGVELHRSLPGEEALLAREAEALLLADHPHLVPILDVATDAGVVLVRPLLPRDLGDWLRERGSPQPGEAVTALAPIAAALGALHAVGAALGGVPLQQVRLDADGAPLLLGEGARVETARPSPAWREASAAVAADVDGWRALAETVLAATDARVPEPVEQALARLDVAAAGEALLAAWPALPLVLAPRPAPLAVPRAPMRRRERAAGFGAVWARAALLLEHLTGRMPPLRAPKGLASRRVADRLRSVGLGSVRPRVWAVAGAGVAAAAAAALLLPAGAAEEPSASVHATAAPAPAEPAATSRSEPRATAPASGAASPPTEDPVTGAAMLLAEREACLDADDAACLVSLHDPGSPQLSAEHPWRMPPDGRLELVQRLGDAWLLRVVSDAEPASVLVMSSEAGWLLRDAWSVSAVGSAWSGQTSNAPDSSRALTWPR